MTNFDDLLKKIKPKDFKKAVTENDAFQEAQGIINPLYDALTDEERKRVDEITDQVMELTIEEIRETSAEGKKRYKERIKFLLDENLRILTKKGHGSSPQ